MNIILHTDKCITCGSCVAVAPDLFTIDSGVVAFKKDPKTWDENDWKKAKDAAAVCPSGVIEIIEK
ncbi:ferredoxin [Patescibacteria group bacterium]|nr:ferredoxin [Patescibacteria group bacterium]